MSMAIARTRFGYSLPLSLLIAIAAAGPARAGGHKARVLVPVYAQAPATALYPVATTTTTYAAPAPLVYSAPTTAGYSAPVSYAPPGSAPVGNAPGMIAGSRIKPVDRADIIEELRAEYRKLGNEGSRRDRRKTLRESARTNFGEAIGDDGDSLNDSEVLDIENIIISIMGNDPSQPGGQAPTVTNGPNPAPAYPYSYPTQYPSSTAYAPVQFYQPVVPVQLYVPVRPKHHPFHHP